MPWGSRQRALAGPLLALASTLSLGFTASAQAQTEGSASGNVTIIQPVGAGVAFDVRSQVLTAIFLSGQIGEQLSLFLPSNYNGRGPQPSEVQTFAAPDNIVVLSSGTISINLTAVQASPGLIGREGVKRGIKRGQTSA